MWVLPHGTADVGWLGCGLNQQRSDAVRQGSREWRVRYHHDSCPWWIYHHILTSPRDIFIMNGDCRLSRCTRRSCLLLLLESWGRGHSQSEPPTLEIGFMLRQYNTFILYLYLRHARVKFIFQLMMKNVLLFMYLISLFFLWLLRVEWE